MDKETLFEKVQTKLISENKSDSTIRTYLYAIKLFVNFCKKDNVTEINNEDLSKYSKSIFKANKKKSGTIKTYKFGINYAFNKILNQNLQIDLIPTPKSVNFQKEYFSKKEISLFFLTILNYKHNTIFKFMYALGVDINEIINVKITDIDSSKKNVTIRDNNGEIKRIAFLPSSLLSVLREYYKIYKPTKYLFEGQNKNSAITERTIQHTFKINFDKTGINKNLSTRSLKNSYVKHLTEDGIPLNSILRNLNIKTSESLQNYTEICFPIKIYNSSPLDTLQQEFKEFDFFDTTDLEYLLIKVTDKEERDYLEEGIRCFKANALRAGVIFLWTASIYKIQKLCLTEKLGYINRELKLVYANARTIKVIDDFGYIKDEYLLEMACRIKVIDKTKKEILKKDCLDLRNKCGHPGKYKPKSIKIKAFVEDIIGMLYEK